MKLIHKGKDITQLMTKLTWSGDYKQAARTVEFGIASHPHDPYLPKVNLAMGDLIKLFDDAGNELFQGYVFFKDKSISSSEMTVTAYDGLIYLLKSKGTYNFKKITPGAITKKIGADFGIPTANIIEGKPITRIFDGESIYNIIMTAYKIESTKTNKMYMPKMENGKLNIITKGTTVTKIILEDSSNIIDSNYSESIEDAINKVKIYDEKGKYLGEVKIDGIPGVLQDVYKGKDAKTMAKTLLKGIERAAGIEVLGDVSCIAGNAITIKEPYTGLNGLFYINTDTHTFENGTHKMSLGLAFQNMMDGDI